MTNPPAWWPLLVETALLGTARRAPDLRQLPPELVPTDAALSAEKTLLRVAALVANYGWAGAVPVAVPMPALPVCPPENSPYAPDSAIWVLNRLLSNPNPNRSLLGYWLTRCQERGWVVPPAHLLPLLGAGNGLTGSVEALRWVIGERGRWLAQASLAWAYLLETDPQTTWADGSSPARRQVFEQRRATDAAGAMSWLRAIWPDETTRDRIGWVRLLDTGLNLADESFLLDALADVRAVRHRKDVHKSLEAELEARLLSLPGSALVAQTRQELAISYVRDEIGQAGTVTRVLTVPVAEQVGLIRRAAWLHPAVWTSLLNQSIRQTIRLLRTAVDETTFVPDGIVMALQRAAVRHKAADWAVELLPFLPDNQQAGLLALLPQPVWEDRLCASGNWLREPGSYTFLTSDDTPRWSAQFSRFVWQELGRLLMQQYQFYPAQRQFVAAMIRHIDPVIRHEPPYAAPVDTVPPTPDYAAQAVQNQLVTPVLAELDLLADIEKL